MVFHGCREAKNVNNIAHYGFDNMYSASDDSVNLYGHGVYFAQHLERSEPYCCPSPKELVQSGAPLGSRIAFVGVLTVGSCTVGRASELRPPRVPASKSGRRFDTFCNADDNPTIFVATDNDQTYPAYIICF